MCAVMAGAKAAQKGQALSASTLHSSTQVPHGTRAQAKEEEEVLEAACRMVCAACRGRHRAHTCGETRAAPSGETRAAPSESSIHVDKHPGSKHPGGKHEGGKHEAGKHADGTHMGGMHMGGTSEASTPAASKVAMGKSDTGKAPMGDASAACTPMKRKLWIQCDRCTKCIHAPMRPCVHTGTPMKRKLWIQCDRCTKWRRLPGVLADDTLLDTWTCDLNPDRRRRTCDAPEEAVSESDAVVAKSSVETRPTVATVADAHGVTRRKCGSPGCEQPAGHQGLCSREGALLQQRASIRPAKYGQLRPYFDK